MKLLTDFQAYLHQQGYTKSTIRTYGYGVAQFTEWTISQGLRMSDIRYPDVLQFVRYCRGQGQGQSHGQTRMHVRALKLLFALLREQKRVRHNPARQVHLKSRGKRLPHNLLEYDVVKQLYEDYPNEGAGKLILGLLCFQALRREEVALLRVRHLHLKQGKLQVPDTHLSNGRLLSLSSVQIIALYEWTKHKAPKDFLLSSAKGTQNLMRPFLQLYQELRMINPAVRDGRQIRQSVITHWLKHYDIRVVQYMAGHKWVSSTERYRQTNLEDLQDQLDKYHPLQ